MCEHTNSIEDFVTGDIICISFGLILDQIYLHSANVGRNRHNYDLLFSRRATFSDDRAIILYYFSCVVTFMCLISYRYFVICETEIPKEGERN